MNTDKTPLWIIVIAALALALAARILGALFGFGLGTSNSGDNVTAVVVSDGKVEVMTPPDGPDKSVLLTVAANGLHEEFSVWVFGRNHWARKYGMRFCGIAGTNFVWGTNSVWKSKETGYHLATFEFPTNAVPDGLMYQKIRIDKPQTLYRSESQNLSPFNRR